MRLFFAALTMLPLAACVVDMPQLGPVPGVGAPAPGLPGGGTNDQCRAASLQGLVGQPDSVLSAMTLPAPVRIVQPGQPMTMDYNPVRLNILIDAGRRIEQIYCG